MAVPDTWMMAMTKAIEVVDAKSASLDELTSRYTDMLDRSIDRMSNIKMAPVSAPDAPGHRHEHRDADGTSHH